MNKLIIYTLSLLTLYSCENAGNSFNSISIHNPAKASTPEALITPGKLCWKAAAITATPPNNSLSIQSSNSTGTKGELLQAKFEKDGTFRFLYSNVQVTGTVTYSKNKQGKNILSTHAKTCISSNTKQPVTTSALKSLYSNSYRWEKISFPGMPSEDFLLLVNLDAHPEAAAAKTGSIDKTWVSKFHIR